MGSKVCGHCLKEGCNQAALVEYIPGTFFSSLCYVDGWAYEDEEAYFKERYNI